MESEKSVEEMWKQIDMWNSKIWPGKLKVEMKY